MKYKNTMRKHLVSTTRIIIVKRIHKCDGLQAMLNSLLLESRHYELQETTHAQQ